MCEPLCMLVGTSRCLYTRDTCRLRAFSRPSAYTQAGGVPWNVQLLTRS